MVDEEAVLAFMRKQAYKPMTLPELAESIGLEAGERPLLADLLAQLERVGKVVRTRAGRYGLPDRMGLIVGRLQGHGAGYAFLLPEEEGVEDVYISRENLHGAMHGDRVIVRLIQGTAPPRSGLEEIQRKEGEVIRILVRANQRVVGTLQISHQFGFVVPDDKRIYQDIFVPPEGLLNAQDGQKVVVTISAYPDESRRSPEGVITEVIGFPGEVGVDIRTVVRKYDLAESFSDEVLFEAEQIPDQVSPRDLSGRRDLRDRPIVTIDGEDTKDFDDAVDVLRLSNGHIRLGVHIADVAYYVREGTAIDREAYRRGTSVYLVDRVLPMLPERLSNGICSLNPRVPRLTLSVDAEIDEQGEVVSYELYPSVIQTVERMTYNAVNQVLEGEPWARQRYAPLVDDFQLMAELARTLNEKRQRRGSIDFDFPEVKVRCDEEGHPLEIVKVIRGTAERIIEEFMLCANEIVAEAHFKRDVPFLYRVHERPDPDKIKVFADFVYNFGYRIRGANTDEVTPKALQELLAQVKGSPEELLIQTLLLRSLKQAHYAAVPLGHFSLATRYYTHFTSPIRRYPDLQIHRIIRELFGQEGLSPQRRDHLEAILPEVADHTSERERVATDAERESEDVKKAEYMADKVGQQFDGTISGVTSFGLFVEMENTVEGLLHVSQLTDDYYAYDETRYALIGQSNRRSFRLGDPIRVEVIHVNVEEKTIDLTLAKTEEEKQAEAAAALQRHFRGERERGRGPSNGTGGRGSNPPRSSGGPRRPAAGDSHRPSQGVRQPSSEGKYKSIPKRPASGRPGNTPPRDRKRP